MLYVLIGFGSALVGFTAGGAAMIFARPLVSLSKEGSTC